MKQLPKLSKGALKCLQEVMQALPTDALDTMHEKLLSCLGSRRLAGRYDFGVMAALFSNSMAQFQIFMMIERALKEAETGGQPSAKTLDAIMAACGAEFDGQYGAIKSKACQDCQKATQGHWPIYSSTCPQCTERMLEAGKEEYK